MPFTYDLTTDLGKVRLHLADTIQGNGVKPGGENFSDEELQVLLDAEGSPMRAVAAACEVLATTWARLVNTAIGPRREDLGMVAKMYQERAARYREQHGGGQVISSAATVRLDAYSDDIADDEVSATTTRGSEYRKARENVRTFP